MLLSINIGVYKFMRELNKFQIVTVIFLLMFVFVVGAIYTNTKDAVENKIRTENNVQNTDDYYKYKQNLSSVEIDKIKNLSQRVDLLEQKITNTENENKGSTGIKCRIHGIMDGDDVISLSQENALKEAQYNRKELVILCDF